MEVSPVEPITFPPVECILEDNKSNPFNDFNIESCKDEMIESGLEESDIHYVLTAYKNLEDVRYIRIHCTSCDKHIGSAPDELPNRYQHPLLKVLMCGECFQFYSTGDFETDEDGSELYCRWCGEGGQVFCCTKCPFVFCKKCITRNLGRGITAVIQNSDNWSCFSCEKSQIRRHRATYWAIQKYSQELIKRAQVTGDKTPLSVDSNICCSSVKKRTDVYTKLAQQPAKKRKTPDGSMLEPAIENKKSKPNYDWKPYLISDVPEDEVICTPDIIPIDESPPNSPASDDSPPPMVPFVIPYQMPLLNQALNHTMRPNRPALPRLPPNVNINLQKQIQSSFSQRFVFTPTTTIQNNNKVISLVPKPGLVNNCSYRFIINQSNSTVKTPAQQNSPVTTLANNLKPVSTSSNNLNPISTSSNNVKPISNSSNNVKSISNSSNNVKSISNSSNNVKPISTSSRNTDQMDIDWFDQAVMDCAEATEYISTKISNLSGVHKRAYKSDKLMEELHSTFQTYLDIAINKFNRIKQITQNNFAVDMEKNFNTKKFVNPFAVTKSSKKGNSRRNSVEMNAEKQSKSNIVSTDNIKPEDVLFDMDVTNASDEEANTPRTSSRSTPINDLPNDEKAEQAINNIDNDVIHIPDSGDELEPEEKINKVENLPEKIDSEIVVLLKKIQDKYEIRSIPSEELLKHLSAVVVVENNNKIVKMDENISVNLISRMHDLLNNDEQNKSQQLIASETDNNEEGKETTSANMCDLEDILNSNIVLRNSKPVASFGDEFSKFICKEKESDDDTESINLAKELDIINDICKRDNGSLSLPPDSIAELSIKEVMKSDDNV